MDYAFEVNGVLKSMTQKCTGSCKQELPLDQFNKNKAKKNGYNTICRLCSRERSKLYYAENKELHIQNTLQRNRDYKNKLKDFLDNYKRSRGCFFCDEAEPCCLDFHHKDSAEKEANISHLYARKQSISRIMKEVIKCEVVCSNCHRKLHAGLLTMSPFGVAPNSPL